MEQGTGLAAQPQSMDEWAKYIYDWCERKGWNEGLHLPNMLMNLHSEIAEAWEEVRNGQEFDFIYTSGSNKPEGVPIEIADFIIRVLHILAWRKVCIDEQIKKEFGTETGGDFVGFMAAIERGRRKWAEEVKGSDLEMSPEDDTDIQLMLDMHDMVSETHFSRESLTDTLLVKALTLACELAMRRSWNLQALLAIKMAYNEKRPYRHGGKTA